MLCEIPLHDLEYLEGAKDAVGGVESGMGVVSRLYLARVMKVEDCGEKEKETLPLVYHRRTYTSIGN
jgi:hypothetical protein